MPMLLYFNDLKLFLLKNCMFLNTLTFFQISLREIISFLFQFFILKNNKYPLTSLCTLTKLLVLNWQPQYAFCILFMLIKSQ